MRDSERDIDIVNTQVRVFGIKVVIVEYCNSFRRLVAIRSVMKAAIGAVMESLTPLLAQSSGFTPGFAQFLAIPTYFGVIGALELGTWFLHQRS